MKIIKSNISSGSYCELSNNHGCKIKVKNKIHYCDIVNSNLIINLDEHHKIYLYNNVLIIEGEDINLTIPLYDISYIKHNKEKEE